MSDDIRKKITLDRIAGQEIPPELVEKLRVANRVEFPLRPTVSDGVSRPADIPDTTDVLDDDTLRGYVDHVKDMEAIAKQMEDMYDDLTKDMNIPPSSDRVAEAARAINPDGTPNITRDTIDRAEAILEALPIMRLGYDPVLLVLAGDGSIDGPFLRCNEVTKSMVNAWEVGANNDTAYTTPTENDIPPTQSLEDAKNAFDIKLKSMAAYIIAMLWWNVIWGRTVQFALGLLEKTVAIPIDTPILLFKWKRPTKRNREKYGPVTKKLNKLKIHLLCTVPNKAWRDYKPDEGIYVLDKRGRSVPISQYCTSSDKSGICPEGTISSAEAFSGGVEDFDGSKIKNMKNQMDAIFPAGAEGCIDVDFWRKLMNTPDPKGPDIPPECAKHAMTVLNAASEDSLTYSEYRDQSSQFTAATQGDVGAVP